MRGASVKPLFFKVYRTVFLPVPRGPPPAARGAPPRRHAPVPAQALRRAAMHAAMAHVGSGRCAPARFSASPTGAPPAGPWGGGGVFGYKAEHTVRTAPVNRIKLDSGAFFSFGCSHKRLLPLRRGASRPAVCAACACVSVSVRGRVCVCACRRAVVPRCRVCGKKVRAGEYNESYKKE